MNSKAAPIIEDFLARASETSRPIFSGFQEAVEQIRRVKAREGDSTAIKLALADNFALYGRTKPEAIIGYLRAIQDFIDYFFFEKLYLADSIATELEEAIAVTRQFSVIACARALLELAADINYHLRCCDFRKKVDLDDLASRTNCDLYGSLDKHLEQISGMPPSSVRRAAVDEKLALELYANVFSALRKCLYLHNKTRTNWRAFVNEDRWGTDFDDKSIIEEATNVVTTIKHLRFSGFGGDSYTPMHSYYILSDTIHPAFGQADLVTASASTWLVRPPAGAFGKDMTYQVFSRELKASPQGRDVTDRILKIVLYPASRSLVSILESIDTLQHLSQQLHRFAGEAARAAGVLKTRYENIRDGVTSMPQ